MSNNQISKAVRNIESVTLIESVSGGVAGTTYVSKFVPCVFDKSKYKGYKGIYFRGSLTQSTAGTHEAYARLYNVTTGTAITGSEIAGTLAQFGRAIKEVEVSSLLATGSNAYWLQLKGDGTGTAAIEGGAIVVRY